MRIVATQDVFLFRSVYRTTRPNEATSIAIPLGFPGNDSTLVVDAGLRVEPDRRDHYQLIQLHQYHGRGTERGRGLRRD